MAVFFSWEKWFWIAQAQQTVKQSIEKIRSCQYEILHVICNEDEFDTGPPDLDTFVQIQQKTKYGFLKNMSFLKKN